MPNWKKLIVSGSDASLNSLTVVNGITGSLFGTSSWAVNAGTASYVVTALTASYINPLNQNVSINGALNVTGSFNLSGSTGNIFTTNIDTMVFTGSILQSGSINVNGSITATSFTGSLLGTASWAQNSSTASYVENAQTASYVLQAVSASFASAATTFNISSSLYSAQGTSAGVGTTTIASIATSSYTAGFFDYTLSSGSNARAGTVMSVWNGSSVQYTDNSTTDIGTTTSVTMSVALSGANALLRATVNSSTWNVKTTYRLI